MRLGLLIAVLVVGGVIALAITRGGSSDKKSAAPSQAAEQKAFAGSPPVLAAVHTQQNQLLDGGTDAFKQRIQALKGHPVVVNKWAAWCGPCRQEFPVFQKVAVQFGKRVAFLGVDSQDNNGSAKRFLGQFPVSYPSYSDPNLKIAQAMDAVGAFPTTVIYNSNGKIVNTHIGPYTSDAALVADIKRYAE
ncbi:MAG TPA: TlpA disulfide reductase family protein [Thermoleophilaceae bacterium]|jgi:thiol-disulfide isomerase/thioredoxin